MSRIILILVLLLQLISCNLMNINDIKMEVMINMRETLPRPIGIINWLWPTYIPSITSITYILLEIPCLQARASQKHTHPSPPPPPAWLHRFQWMPQHRNQKCTCMLVKLQNTECTSWGSILLRSLLCGWPFKSKAQSCCFLMFVPLQI